MSAPERAEVAVIGGGILGLACGYEMARAGAEVVVFERRALASGTTGGSAGVVCQHDLGELYAVLSLVGHERILSLEREHGFPFHRYGSLSYWRNGQAEPGPSAFETAYGSGPDGIYHRDRLTATQLRSRYFWLPDDVAGGDFFPNQGFINPYQLVELYAELGRRTGRLTVLPGTPVLALDHEGTRITRLITRRGPVQVDTVINAAGPWGAKIGRLGGVDLDLIPQRIQVAVATGFEAGVGRAPLVGWPDEVGGQGGWCRGEEGEMLLFGQHRHLPDPAYTVDPDHCDLANDADFPDQVGTMIRNAWRLPRSRFLPGWNCVYGMTPDGYPLVGRSAGAENLISVLGCNGHGITLHAGLAKAVAALVLHGETMIELAGVPGAPATLETDWLSPDRFTAGRPLRFDPEHPTPAAQLV